MQGEIRRRFLRWQVSYPAKLTVDDEAVAVSCQVEDVSLKGLCLSLGVRLKENKSLRLRFEFADDLVFNAVGLVSWHIKNGEEHSYGVYFERVADKEKDKLYTFVRRYFPEELKRRWWGEETKEEGGETMEDRRIFERFPANFSLRYINLNSQLEGQAQTQDISAKGIRLVSDAELKPNSAVELWLQAPGRNEPFYTRGEVAWSTSRSPGSYESGVNLERIDFMGISRLLKL